MIALRLCTAALGLLLLCAPAGAVEGEWQLALEPTYGLAYGTDRPLSGGGGLLHLSYAPRDTFAVQLLGGVTAHPLSDGAAPGTLLAFSVGAGLVYVIDVVRVVPFFEASVALLGRALRGDGGAATRMDLGLGVGFGADYLVSRRLSVGVAFRWAAALTDLSGLPLYFLAGPRLTGRFGL